VSSGVGVAACDEAVARRFATRVSSMSCGGLFVLEIRSPRLHASKEKQVKLNTTKRFVLFMVVFLYKWLGITLLKNWVVIEWVGLEDRSGCP
jgi:hypothetical protein